MSNLITLLTSCLSIVLIILLCIMEINHRKKIRQYQAIIHEQIEEIGEVYSKLIEWRQELRTAKEMMDDERKKISPQLRDVFDKAFYDKYLFTGDSERMFAEVDKRLCGFVTLLRNNHAELNTKECKLCILYLLMIPNNDICIILDYSINSLPTIKNRLCSKLQVEHASNLINYLENYLKH